MNSIGMKTIQYTIFALLPTVHYSGRGIGDKNKSLWCSWAISSSVGQYYFIGDSTYSHGNHQNDLKQPQKSQVIPLKTFGYIRLVKPEYYPAMPLNITPVTKKYF